MRDFDEALMAHHYSNTKGFYSKDFDPSPPTQAEQVWSKMAQDNPIHAAAATTLNDPFAKYPISVEAEIPDQPSLILDAGCGYGRVAIPLLRKKAKIKIVGVDASPVMLSYFLELVNREESVHSMTERLRLVHSNINQLLFEEGTFDIVFSCAVLLHNPYRDVASILEEFHRVLRPQGKLVLLGSFPNIYNLEGIQAYLALKRIDEATHNGPIRVYTRARVHRLFHQWSHVRVIPTGATLIPRQIGKRSLPFGGSIRAINTWIEQREIELVVRTSLLAKSLDVVAVK